MNNSTFISKALQSYEDTCSHTSICGKNFRAFMFLFDLCQTVGGKETLFCEIQGAERR